MLMKHGEYPSGAASRGSLANMQVHHLEGDHAMDIAP
jgi:hypothetical protein